MNLKENIRSLAQQCGADIVGIAPSSRFDADDPVFRIFPEVKSVICLVFRVLRGIYRGIEEGSTYYQYTTMGVENMEETVMPMAALRVSNFLETQGYTALPQRRHQTIMAEKGSVNPEVAYTMIYEGCAQETQMRFGDAAVKCGVGELGFHGALLTDAFGPMVRWCFVLTDCVLEGDEVRAPHLCDKCGACASGCPGRAIDSGTGELDKWKCAVYYNGACGLKNPFMPPDAFEDLEDRLSIIAGEAGVDEQKAKQILNRIYFYPPAQHSYQCSICGRACDVACYCHLEEKGVLTKKFRTRVRKREPWHFSIEDFLK